MWSSIWEDEWHDLWKNNEDLDIEGEEEEYRATIGPRSQAMSKLRDDIAASLMGARN